MGSTRKGSIKCGLSVGKAKSAKLSVRVRGERRTVSGSVEPGHVLQIVTQGDRILDQTDPDRATIKLPSERNGLAMVFRTFDRVSYVLLLQLGSGVRVGDRLINPN